MAELKWRVMLVAELEPGVVTETELARIVRVAQASLAELGLRLAHEQEAPDALEQGHGAALPGRPHRRAERHARGAFRRRHPGFRPANDDHQLTGAAA